MQESHPVIRNKLLEEILRPRRMLFIVNPKAGTRLQRRIEENVDHYLDHRKFIYGIRLTEKRGHAYELAKQALEENYEVVVAVGGDGSINEVASALLGTDIPLGIIPAGSGNGLAMHLGYGRNIRQAIQKLNTAVVRSIDCGMMNDRPFFNLAGIGFDGLVSNQMKRHSFRGFIPYFLESVVAGLRYQSRDCILELNGETISEKCFAIAVANGPMYGYNFQIAPGARLDDGLFSVVVMKDAPRWKYFAALPASLKGRILEEPFVRHFTTDKLRIRCSGPNYVHIDGEGLTLENDLEFVIRPRALNILAPYRIPVPAEPAIPL